MTRKFLDREPTEMDLERQLNAFVEEANERPFGGQNLHDWIRDRLRDARFAALYSALHSPEPSLSDREADELLRDSLYHLRVDDGARAYHSRVESFLARARTSPAPVGGGDALANIASIDRAWVDAHGGAEAAINDIIGEAQRGLATRTDPLSRAESFNDWHVEPAASPLLADKLAELREALAPFAREAEWMTDGYPDEACPDSSMSVTYADFRRARAALASNGSQG